MVADWSTNRAPLVPPPSASYHPGMSTAAAEPAIVPGRVSSAVAIGAPLVAAGLAIVRIAMAGGSPVARGLAVAAVVLAAVLLARSWQPAACDRRTLVLHVAALAALLVAAGALAPTSLAAGLLVAAAIRIGRDVSGWPGMIALGALAVAHAAGLVVHGADAIAPAAAAGFLGLFVHGIAEPERAARGVPASGRSTSRSGTSTSGTCVAMSVRAGVPEEFGGRGIPPPTEARGFRLSLDVAEPWGGGTIDGRVESIPGRRADARPLTVSVACTAAWVDIAPQLVGRGRLGLSSAYELRARARPIWLDELIYRDEVEIGPLDGSANWRRFWSSRFRLQRHGRSRGPVRVPPHRRGGATAGGRPVAVGAAADPGRAAPRAGHAHRDDADRDVAAVRVARGRRVRRGGRSRVGAVRAACRRRHAAGRRDS